MDHAAELGKSSLFKELPAAELEKLAGIAEEITYNEGDLLVHEGDAPDKLLMIVMGSVSVTKQTPSGEDEQLAVVGSGSYIGESAMVDQVAERAITGRALEKTFVLAFSAEAMHALCEDNTALGYHVYRALALGLAKRARGFARETAYYKSLSLHH